MDVGLIFYWEGGYSKHYWRDLIKSKQLSSDSVCRAQCLLDFLVMVIQFITEKRFKLVFFPFAKVILIVLKNLFRVYFHFYSMIIFVLLKCSFGILKEEIRCFPSTFICSFMVKVLDSLLEVSEFELQSYYQVYFQIDKLEKSINP